MATLEGFHGADIGDYDLIKANNFRISQGDEHWLGDGVYFFVKGHIPPEPQNNAVKWAIAHAWDKDSRQYRYLEYIIIKTLINVEDDRFLDLTTYEGMEVYQYIRNKYIQKIGEAKRRLIDNDFKDGHIINHARQNQILPADVVKGDFYIRFATERRCNIKFRVPNITMIAVYDPEACISKGSIEPYKEGEIKK